MAFPVHCIAKFVRCTFFDFFSAFDPSLRSPVFANENSSCYPGASWYNWNAYICVSKSPIRHNTVQYEYRANNHSRFSELRKSRPKGYPKYTSLGDIRVTLASESTTKITLFCCLLRTNIQVTLRIASSTQAFVRRIKSRGFDEKVMGSNRPTRGQLIHLAVLCCPRSPIDKWHTQFFINKGNKV